MLKICLIQNELKDDEFRNDGEKLNFLIMKALSDSGFQTDLFCVKNNLKNEYPLQNITELALDNFEQNVFSIVNKLNYDLTFSTEYFPSDVVYLHKHSAAYLQYLVKSKFDNLFELLFLNKNYSKAHSAIKKQELFSKHYKLVLTPSTVLKNDLINLLNIDGQKTYILPPAIDMPNHVKMRTNQVFTFGFIADDFLLNGGFILLKALRHLKSFHFKVKILYPYPKLDFWTKYFISLNKLEDAVEFIMDNDDVADFYDAIDSLVLPSKMEAFSMYGLEAMSRGKIVIASSRCGIKDIIEPDNNGFIFNITHTPDINLARVLKYVMTNKDDFENLRQKAVFTASVYNYEKFKNELIRILNKFSKNPEVN